MTRPKKCRRVGWTPGVRYFKPRGIPMTVLEEVRLGVDELESVRLADLEGLEQAKAAGLMKISRPTFGRIVGKARWIIADAIVNGKAIKIEGGDIKMTPNRKFVCLDCAHSWEVPYGTSRPIGCPECRSENIHRAEQDRGYARCGGARRGPCQKGLPKKSIT